MHLQAQLVHCDAERRVVLVTARDGERLLGSALGEAAHAEEAEDRALARLMARLHPAPSQPAGSPSAPTPVAAAPATTPPPGAAPKPEPSLPLPAPRPAARASPAGIEPPKQPPLEPPPDPEDWSAELARLDLEIRRLGWDRDREATYLQRAFGHPSRHHITIYADLIAYLRAIEALQPGCDPAAAPVPLRRADLLSQGERLLERLAWDGAQARRFLEGKLGVSSRQHLSDEQLLQFNLQLESELIETGG